jgi:hypothetical protein
MFIRGFIDGDGSYAKTKHEGKYAFKMYCANAEFMSEFTKNIKSLVNVKVNTYNEGKTIEINNQTHLVKLFKTIYKYKPGLCLSRKLEKAKQHIEYVTGEKVDDIVRYLSEN